MRNAWVAALCVVLLAGCTTAASVDEPNQQQQSVDEPNRQRQAELPSRVGPTIWPAYGLLDPRITAKLGQMLDGAANVECKEVDDRPKLICPVEIKVVTISHNNENYCLALVPNEIKYPEWTGNGNFESTLVWTLNVDLAPPGIIEFQEQHGILILEDNDTDNQPRIGPKRCWGDDNRCRCQNNVCNKQQFNVKNKLKKQKKSAIVYVPIIMHTPVGDSARLCGAIDPKIVND